MSAAAYGYGFTDLVCMWRAQVCMGVRVCRWVSLSWLAVGLPPLNSPHEALSIWSLDFPLTTSMIIIKV